jgi:hypothetical protein
MGKENNMAKVYIVNKSAHDFSAADKYGEVVFLSNGPMNRYSTNNMHREFTTIMEGSTDKDYIVPCSLNVMNSIACAIFAHKHGKLNLLLFKTDRLTNIGDYIERNLVL